MYQDIYSQIKNDVIEGEHILWSGKPQNKVSFSGIDIFITLFALGWLSFSSFGFYTALISYLKTGFIFPVIFMIPFLAIGFFLLFGRFIFEGRIKKNTYYVITEKRVIVIRKKKNSKISEAEFFKNIPSINKKVKRDGSGTISFGGNPNWANMYASPSSYVSYNYQYQYYGKIWPCFIGIENVEHVYNIAHNAWAKIQKNQ